MKEENKKQIVKYLRKEYSREEDKYNIMKHKINIWKQYKELDEVKINLGKKFEQDHLENMFQISLLIEWIERL